MRNGTSLHAARVKGATVCLLMLLFSSLPSPPLHGQDRQEGTSLNFSATLGAMKEATRRDGGWSFPFTARSRFEFFRFFHLEFAWIHVFTHRHEVWGCFDSPCPEPDAVWGSADVLTVGGRLHRDFGVWKPFVGIGKGRGWETQPGEVEEFDGPLWAWYGGVEWKLGGRVALLAEYRGFWQHWEHDFENIPKDIHFRQYQLGVGLRCSVF